MIFDTLCQMAEQKLLDHKVSGLGVTIRELVKEARIFEFPGRSHEVLPAVNFGGRNRRVIKDLFFLPFPVIALEDSASAIILADYHEQALGLNVERFWLECQLIQQSREAEFAHGHSPAPFPTHLEGFAVVTWGTFLNVTYSGLRYSTPSPSIEKRWTIERILRALRIWRPKPSEPAQQPETDQINWRLKARVRVTLGSFAAKRLTRQEARQTGGKRGQWKVFLAFRGDEREIYGSKAAQNALVAMKEVAVFNLPGRFLVEKTRIKEKKQRLHRDRIPRSDGRPHYILLEPKEYRAAIGQPEVQDDSGEKKVRERRAHLRFLQHPRFTPEKRFTWVPVKAVIDGPTKGKSPDGGHNYRIIDAVPHSAEE